MELSPKAITGVEFRTVRKGYDPDEVRSFLAQLARGVEAVQTQAATSDQRARAAIAKLQEQGAAPRREEEAPPSDQASRLLVLAQKTADTAVAEAEAEAKSIVASAEERARDRLAEAEARAQQLVADAEDDARRAASVERARVQTEVDALLARRTHLYGEAERLEKVVVSQRSRIEASADALRRALEGPDGLVPTEIGSRPGNGQDGVDERRARGEAAGAGEGDDNAWAPTGEASAVGYAVGEVHDVPTGEVPEVSERAEPTSAAPPPPPATPLPAEDAPPPPPEAAGVTAPARAPAPAPSSPPAAASGAASASGSASPSAPSAPAPPAGGAGNAVRESPPAPAPVAPSPAIRPRSTMAAAVAARMADDDEDDDVAGQLAMLGGDDEGNGPITQEVPVIGEDDELVRNFFDGESTFADDRWKPRGER